MVTGTMLSNHPVWDELPMDRLSARPLGRIGRAQRDVIYGTGNVPIPLTMDSFAEVRHF